MGNLQYNVLGRYLARERRFEYLINSGKFHNLVYDEPYWSATEDASEMTKAWVFRFHIGTQHTLRKYKDGKFAHAWAVLSGDVLSSRKAQSPAARPTRMIDAVWKTVGLWDHDAVDSRHLPQGFVLRNKLGNALGQSWNSHLEFKDHASLVQRQRSLWPVSISTGLRKICVNAPGYPGYPVFVDMPGQEDDGMYVVSFCKGGSPG